MLRKNTCIFGEGLSAVKKAAIGPFSRASSQSALNGKAAGKAADALRKSLKEVREHLIDIYEPYSHRKILNKETLTVNVLPSNTDEELVFYINDRQQFHKDMRKIARDYGEVKNQGKSVFLECDDLSKKIMVIRKSYNHGAERINKNYIAVARILPKILKNSIVINELLPRRQTM